MNIKQEEKKEELPIIEKKIEHSIPEKKEEPPKEENNVSVIPESTNKTDTIKEKIEDTNTNKEVKNEDTSSSLNKEKIVNEKAIEDKPILNKSEEPLKVVEPIVLERTEVSLTEKKDVVNISNKGSISNTQKSLPKIEEPKKNEISPNKEEENKEVNKPIIELKEIKNESSTNTSNNQIPVIQNNNEKKEEIKEIIDKPKEDSIPKVDTEEYKLITSSPMTLPPAKKSITSPYEPPRELHIDIPSLDIQSDFTEKINDTTKTIPKKPTKTKSPSKEKKITSIPEITE